MVYISQIMYIIFCRFHGDEATNFWNKLLLFDETDKEIFNSFSAIDPENNPNYWISTKLLRIFMEQIRLSLQFGFILFAVIGAALPMTVWNGFLPLMHLLPIHIKEDVRNVKGVGVMIRIGVFLLTFILKEGFMDEMIICKNFSFIMSPFCINSCLVRIERYMEKVTEPSLKGLESTVFLQKQILLLSKIYNQSHGIFITGFTMLQGFYSVIFSSFILITASAELHGHEILLTVVGFVVGVSLLLASHMPGQVHKSFKSMSNIIKSRIAVFGNTSTNGERARKVRTGKVLMKSIRAIYPIRIALFSNNFFDELTPLVLLETTFSRTVDRILVG
ncbi:unnamed protein product [Orchesella dallaii]|uniref:ABC transmembrane type-1 domain-containing protein n=1 Tax=Orchesella dallaii TaxID=48710 RepID=A0ABP1PI48_9HEXA